MNSTTSDLLWEIINCPYGKMNNLQGDPCQQVINSQAVTAADFHAPEPWNGDIENAPILFIGPNPGITANELFPQKGAPYWQNNQGFNQERVEEFFEKRFSDDLIFAPQPYVLHNNGKNYKVLLKSGVYKPVKGFWNYVYEIARYQLKRPVIPGVDYVITEVARCKSKNINSLPQKCVTECMNKFFERTLDTAQKVQLIFVVGRNARIGISQWHIFQSSYPGIPQLYTRYSIQWKGRKIDLAFIHHNAKWGEAPRQFDL